MLYSYIYTGNYQHQRQTHGEDTILHEDVCSTIIDKYNFELIKKQKEKDNSRKS